MQNKDKYIPFEKFTIYPNERSKTFISASFELTDFTSEVARMLLLSGQSPETVTETILEAYTLLTRSTVSDQESSDVIIAVVDLFTQLLKDFNTKLSPHFTQSDCKLILDLAIAGRNSEVAVSLAVQQAMLRI